MILKLNKEVYKIVIRKIAGRLALKILSEVKIRTPVQSGIARNSVVIKEDKLGFIIGTNLNYWNFIEEDTKPHEIVPKLAHALRFEINKEFRFAKKVHHPGTEGYHIFKNIVEDNDLLERFLKESIQEINI
jgi:hypothetical protein